MRFTNYDGWLEMQAKGKKQAGLKWDNGQHFISVGWKLCEGLSNGSVVSLLLWYTLLT